MDFFVVDAEGNIVRTGSCDDAELNLQAKSGETVHQGHANGLTQFYDNGLHDYGPAQIDDRLTGVRQGFRWSRGQWIDERPLEQVKVQKWAVIKRARDMAEFGTFIVGGYQFDADRDSQTHMTSAFQSAMDARTNGEPFSIDWTLADNTPVTLTRAQVIAVGRAMQAHVSAQHDHARQLRAQIAAAITKEQVNAIVW